MHITAIEEQKKNKNRLNVFIDGDFSFGIHLDVLLDYHLKTGQELTENQITEIKTADAFRTSYDKAINFLSHRPHSIHETRQYLRDKLIYHHPDYPNVPDGAAKEEFIAQQHANINRIVDKLIDQKYLDDVAFAKWWIDNRRQFKPRGKRLLLLELQAKGVSLTDLETALTTPDEEGHFHSETEEESGVGTLPTGRQGRESGAYNETEAALDLARKYAQKRSALPERDLHQKLNRYLASKGFDWDTTDKVWRKIREEAE